MSCGSVWRSVLTEHKPHPLGVLYFFTPLEYKCSSTADKRIFGVLLFVNFSSYHLYTAFNVTTGTWRDEIWPDNWTAVTQDGKRSAQFEHTFLVTETGCEVLTVRRAKDGQPFFMD